jgi:hypothetical protein
LDPGFGGDAFIHHKMGYTKIKLEAHRLSLIHAGFQIGFIVKPNGKPDRIV